MTEKAPSHREALLLVNAWANRGGGTPSSVEPFPYNAVGDALAQSIETASPSPVSLQEPAKSSIEAALHRIERIAHECGMANGEVQLGILLGDIARTAAYALTRFASPQPSPVSLPQCVLDLIAVLCGDGGHYLDENGLEAACKNGEQRFYAALATPQPSPTGPREGEPATPAEELAALAEDAAFQVPPKFREGVREAIRDAWCGGFNECTDRISTPETASPSLPQCVLDLLAVMNRDGGHYHTEHGTEAACKRATERYYEVLNASPSLPAALSDVAAERVRQDEKWGGAEHDDAHSVNEFVQLIEDYAGWARTMAGMDSYPKARRRLIQVAALAVAACECIDRATFKVPAQAPSIPPTTLG